MTTRQDEAPAVWAFEEHEHHDLERGLNRIHDVAGQVGLRSRPELSADLRSVLAWLDQTLEPHIAWEDGWLYPEIDARTGTAWATRSCRFDHSQIRRQAERVRTDQLSLTERSTAEADTRIRADLFGLEALLRAHIEREERFLIPLLREGRAGGPATPPGQAR
jgi:iron-sulfur cluster repair protein YtfE (RIC family)